MPRTMPWIWSKRPLRPRPSQRPAASGVGGAHALCERLEPRRLVPGRRLKPELRRENAGQGAGH